jgi:hypothetical protein
MADALLGPLEPVLTEQLDRVQSADRAIAASEIFGGAVLSYPQQIRSGCAGFIGTRRRFIVFHRR